jgi:hypothetical protein
MLVFKGKAAEQLLRLLTKGQAPETGATAGGEAAVFGIVKIERGN